MRTIQSRFIVTTRSKTDGHRRRASRAAPRQESDPPTEETMSPIAFAPRRPRVKDDETTTILPRSRPTKHRTQALDAIDDYEDDEPTALGKRAKLALIVGAVAAVVVIGLVIGYSVLSVGNQPQSQPSVSPPAGGSGASGGAGQARAKVLAALC